MNADGRDPTNAMRDACNDLEQIEEEKIFVNEVSDGELEAAASGPMITFTLSIDLFACRFC